MDTGLFLDLMFDLIIAVLIIRIGASSKVALVKTLSLIIGTFNLLLIYSTLFVTSIKLVLYWMDIIKDNDIAILGPFMLPILIASIWASFKSMQIIMLPADAKKKNLPPS